MFTAWCGLRLIQNVSYSSLRIQLRVPAFGLHPKHTAPLTPVALTHGRCLSDESFLQTRVHVNHLRPVEALLHSRAPIESIEALKNPPLCQGGDGWRGTSCVLRWAS